jgi:hypothetical protein
MLTIILLSVGLIISIILNCLAYRAITIQLNKLAIYEKWVEEYEVWVANVRGLIQSTYLKMKTVDEKNLFNKDDDVGFIFTELLDLLKYLNDRVK